MDVGRVLKMQSDGTTVPIDGATVDVFRVDIVGRYNTKTARDGLFVFAGLPYVGDYLIAASAPNAKPHVIANVKVGREIEYELVLERGDGTRLTREEAETAFRGDPKPETANETLSRTFRMGNEALTQRLYDEAIKLFDEALAIRPDEPVLFLRKSAAFRQRGVEEYNTAISTHDEAMKSASLNSARRDFREAAECASRAVELINTQIIPADESDRANQHRKKMVALNERAEAMRVLVIVDPAQASVGFTALQEYIEAEDDPSRKSKAELDAARMLLEAKSTKSAIEQYRRILISDPQNLEAILGYGLALYQSGEKDRFPEAARYLRFFLDQAPGADPRRHLAAETLKNLETVR